MRRVAARLPAHLRPATPRGTILHVISNSPSAPPALPGAGGFRKTALRRLPVLAAILPLVPLLTAAGAAAAARSGGAAAPAGATPAAGAAPAAASATPLAVPAVHAARPASTAAADASIAEVTPAALRGVAGLSRRALAMALDAVSCARARGVAGRDGLLTLIDYSLPSTEPRLWVLDLAHGKVLFHELVAHGAGSGDNYATRFSNTLESRQSSLGLFLTGGTYEGGNGYSLKLRGLDAGLNDRAEERKIVIHGAWYVTADHARSFGRLGRSWGCPALPLGIARGVIDAIKDGSFVYSYVGTASQVAQAASRAASRCAAPKTAAPQAPTPPLTSSSSTPLAPLATAVATALPAGIH
jgi:hypothetical protein